MSQPTHLQETLARECEAMVHHLLATGKRCPAPLVRAVDRFSRALDRGEDPDVGGIAASHAHLSRLVAPGYPATIRMLNDIGRASAARRWRTFGTTMLVRQLMGVALISVAAFVALSLFHYVGGTVHVGEGSGLALLLNELFWLSAASVGASFAMLYQIDQQIGDRTYDPAHAPTAWVKLLLGVVAGFIMATVLAPETHAPGELESGVAVVGSGTVLLQPLLAMLGGFSASLVYTVLNRMVESVEQLFTGSAREQIMAREHAAAQRASGEAAEERVRVAGKLVQVQQQLSAGADPEALGEALQQVIQTLVPMATDGDAWGQNATGAADRVPALGIVASAGPHADGASPPAEEEEETTEEGAMR